MKDEIILPGDGMPVYKPILINIYALDRLPSLLPMPFRVVNHSPRRIPPPMSEKFPVSYGFRKKAAQIPDEASVYSDASSDNGTLHTVYSDVSNKKGFPPGYARDKDFLGYPPYFDDKRRLSDEYDPYAAENLEQASSSSRTRLLGTVVQLANALGPDNILQTTEIDTIPCAGVRIPHGPLKGLLAWRLVVRVPEQGKREDSWKIPNEPMDTRRRVHSMRLLSRPPTKPTYSTSHSACGHTNLKPIDNSLASFGRRSFPNLQDTFTPPQPHRKPIALVSNFILDTSIPHSVISRDALGALGYPLSTFPKNSSPEDSTVTLSIQGVPTRLCIANHGEASRLGVQFLHDAGVSVFFPQNGDGIGPVLYRMWSSSLPSSPQSLMTLLFAVESAQLLKSVPSTLPRFGARERKNTLPRRVKALLGLS